jgi:hypothetical protein
MRHDRRSRSDLLASTGSKGAPIGVFGRRSARGFRLRRGSPVLPGSCRARLV